MSSYAPQRPAPAASSAAASPPTGHASRARGPAQAAVRHAEESAAAPKALPRLALAVPSSFARSQTLQASPSQTLAAAYFLLLRQKEFASPDRDGQKPCNSQITATNKDSEIVFICNARPRCVAMHALCASLCTLSSRAHCSDARRPPQ